MPLARRAALAASCAMPMIATARPVKVLLNTGLPGPQGFLFLAADALAARGIALACTPGSGAHTTAPRLLPAM